MKQNIKKIHKEVIEQGYHLRIFISMLFALIAFLVLPNVVDTAEWAYYKYSTVERFLDYKAVIPEDMCYGELHQKWVTIREVKGTDVGWRGRVVDNFYILTADQSWDEFNLADDSNALKFQAFYEPVEGNRQEIVYEYAHPLPVGTYQTKSIVTLFLPQGVTRENEITIIGDEFDVLNCI